MTGRTNAAGGVRLPELVNPAGAAQILSGYEAINADGEAMVGTIPSQGAQTITPGTSAKTIAAGRYLSGAQTIAGDADLVPANIKSGVNIFGVSGSYKGATPITEKIRSTGSGGSFIDLMLDEDASEVFCACLIGVANNQLCAFVYDGNGNSALGSYWAGSRFLDAEAAISFPNPGFVRFDFSDSQCPTPAERDAWVTYIPV